jgi:LacI family transcriptional regulator
LGRQVDGLIVTGRYADARQPINVPKGMPVVYAMTPSADPADTSIRLDNAGGGRLAVEYLLTTGRRHIAHVTGTARHESALARSNGAHEALAAAAIEPVAGKTLFGNWTEEWGRQAARIAVEIDASTDAIFAGSDQVARGVIDGLTLAGRRVPDDVAVVGYDNWSVMVEGRQPRLSSVEPNLGTAGKVAAQLLMAMIDGEQNGGTHWVAPQLIIRQSSAPATAPPSGAIGEDAHRPAHTGQQCGDGA